MANIYITHELLALFLEGKTTVTETAAILAAAKENLDVRYFLETALEDNMVWKTGVSENPTLSVCKLYTLNARNIPVMRLAASSDANDCVVKCEQYVLSFFEKEADYQTLLQESRKHDWLRKDGTPLYNIGRLLELDKLSVARRFGGSLEMLQKEIEGGCSIIVALNAESLTTKKNCKTAEANHAVVVLDVNLTEGYVEVYDPLSSSPTDTYTFSNFVRSWECSKNFWVSIVERGIRPYIPHPEYVEDIELPESIVPLADMLAENAHEIWAKGRLAEAEEESAKGKEVNPYDDPYMKPFMELPSEKKTTDYLSSLNTIKLLYKLGFEIVKGDKTTSFEYKPNVRTADGQFIPQPIDVDDVVLPKEIADLTEYIAENTHEEWAMQRIKEGYKYAPKTNKKRLENADLIPYCELLDSEKEYDRKMAMNTLRVLYKLGYEIIKQ